MATCRTCKSLTDVNRDVAPDRGWCQVWCNWQRCNAQACKHCEAKPVPPKESYQGRSRQNGGYRGDAKPRYQRPSR